MSLLSRNSKCPCGTGKKYKACCEGKVDWNTIIRSGVDRSPYLSIRGRNLAFLEKIYELFVVDSNGRQKSLPEYKKSFSTQAVRTLNEEIVRLWPKDIDIAEALRPRGSDVAGLYVGDYSSEQLLGAVVRHSLYANKLLIVDPFLYPLSVRDEYSPILNPNQYRTQTLRNVNLWLALQPWIEERVVEIVRTPADFNQRLQWESMKLQQKKFDESPELQEAAKITVNEFKKRHVEQWRYRDLVLSLPDEALIEKLEEIANEEGGVSKEALLGHVRREREADPDFLEVMGTGESQSQLTMITTGAMYNVACLTASLTGAYLVTDLTSKWKEIELDRAGHSEQMRVWSPFARALQGVELKYLNNVNIDAALTLRKEERLQNLRAFLRRIWRQACDPDSFESVNGLLFAEELQSEIVKANEEWKQIDRELLKYGGGASAGLITSLPMIGTGQGEFLAAASVVAGGIAVAASAWQRRGFEKKFPASFFLKL